MSARPDPCLLTLRRAARVRAVERRRGRGRAKVDEHGQVEKPEAIVLCVVLGLLAEPIEVISDNPPRSARPGRVVTMTANSPV